MLEQGQALIHPLWQVASNVWTFSWYVPRIRSRMLINISHSPFSRLGGFLPFGGRSTAIKLKSGGVWVLASTPLEPETKAKIDELGAVKAYPDAKLIAPKEAIENDPDRQLRFDGGEALGALSALFPLLSFFSSFKNKDIAFFHPETKVLIEADLLFNLPATEQVRFAFCHNNAAHVNAMTTSILKRSLRGSYLSLVAFHLLHGYTQDFSGILESTKRAYSVIFTFVSVVNFDGSRAMRRDAKTVAGWDFEKIIPCHGVSRLNWHELRLLNISWDVIESGGNKAWKKAYKFYLTE
ncbi:hypothetical protein DXG03_009758 [Asterophora parasitica]|uniref:Uncharacterized protein n=1 Tax=Asterophora parasitica TaxID=117018 RepID=A0A9P7KC27_9AGAR|nr:hypothetical protein DXG03_009758 [Asterophora parasitica]